MRALAGGARVDVLAVLLAVLVIGFLIGRNTGNRAPAGFKCHQNGDAIWCTRLHLPPSEMP